MVHPSHAQTRPSVLSLLLVAAASAIVVAGVYEVRARLAQHHSRRPADSNVEEQAPPIGQTQDSPSPVHQSCADLRRRYIARCPNDPLTSPFRPQPQAGTSLNRPNEVQVEAELAAWRAPSSRELGDMARRCEVRFEMPAITDDQPPIITEEAAAALSLSSRERALVERTLNDMHTGLRDFAAQTLAGTAGQTPGVTFEDMLTNLQTRPENGFEEAREKLAQERAGLSPPPAGGSQQTPGERLLRLWARMGDDFERRLADGLGSDRARQLRSSPQAVWMNRFSQSGCRSQTGNTPPPPGPFQDPGK
jgi:hypothetical protein